MAKQRLILLYGGRSAEREVSVLSAESVMRAVNYDRFSVKTYFITKDGDFIQTQEFEAKPAADEKLMTNATRLSLAIFTKMEQWSFQFCMVPWAKMVLFKAS